LVPSTNCTYVDGQSAKKCIGKAYLTININNIINITINFDAFRLNEITYLAAFYFV